MRLPPMLQWHRLGFARFQPDRGPGGNVGTEAVCLLAIERQKAVGLEKVEMRADLDRAAAGIDDANGARFRPSLSVMKACLLMISPGFMAGSFARLADRLMDGDEFCAVVEGRFDLDLVDHVGNAVHHVALA